MGRVLVNNTYTYYIQDACTVVKQNMGVGDVWLSFCVFLAGSNAQVSILKMLMDIQADDAGGVLASFGTGVCVLSLSDLPYVFEGECGFGMGCCYDSINFFGELAMFYRANGILIRISGEYGFSIDFM